MPTRILHVLGRLERGGIEVWLMNVLRNLDRSRYQFDFAVHVDSPSAFDEDARRLGAQIHRLRPPRDEPIFYRRNLAKLLRRQGPYDVVHSHAHFFSGVILQTAAKCNVQNRIAHSHNDTRRLDQAAGFARRTYLNYCKRKIEQHATGGLACSSFAAAALFGDQWSMDPRWMLLHYGLDFSRFNPSADFKQLKAKWNIPADRFVIGQISRLDPQKNHALTLRIFKEFQQRRPQSHLLLVGGGALQSQIESDIAALGLSGHVTMAGDQSDVATFLGMMDCKIFPSTHEGLGIVAIEAQAAGVPVVASDRVPEDIRVLPGMVEFVPLDAPTSRWCDVIEEIHSRPRPTTAECKQLMQASDFGIHQCLEKLLRIYDRE
jgi:glycosyltransferase involved in cell wall biosynthesis